MAQERALRLFTLVTTAIALPMLIAITVVSMNLQRHDNYWYGGRSVTAFCFAYIPLTLTAGASAISLCHHRKHGRMPGSRFALLDGFAGVVYLSMLIPIWSLEIGDLEAPGWGLLAGYTTAPMIVNMFIHLFLFVYNVQSIWTSLFGAKLHECPNCHNNFIIGGPKVQQTSQCGATYSLLRGEEYLDADQDAAPYANARESEEQNRPEGGIRSEGKGKAIIDV